MRKFHPPFGLGFLLLLLLVACGPTATPTVLPTPTEILPDDLPRIEPPAATLIIDGHEQRSGIGTYCWTHQSAGGTAVSLCADKIGIPTDKQPLRGGASFVAQLRLPIVESPEELVLTVIPVTHQDELETGRGQWRWWPYGPGTQHILPRERDPELELSLQPGLYVLSVFARWPELGDVTYGFLVQVQS